MLAVVKEQGEPDQQHLDSEYRQLLQSGRHPCNTLESKSSLSFLPNTHPTANPYSNPNAIPNPNTKPKSATDDNFHHQRQYQLILISLPCFLSLLDLQKRDLEVVNVFVDDFRWVTPLICDSHYHDEILSTFVSLPSNVSHLSPIKHICRIVFVHRTYVCIAVPVWSL